MTHDKQIFKLIKKEHNRQRNNLEMIASENYVSKDVLKAAGSILTNKYAEGYPDRRYYRGCIYIDQIEQLAIDRAKKLFRCSYANIQPHSGSQANRAVIEALCEPGDTILSLGLNDGGHLTHGAKVSFSGKYYNIINYGVTPDGGMINYAQLRVKALECKPKLIIAGASAYTGTWDYAFIWTIAKQVGAYFMFDMAHIAGLVATHEVSSPLLYADVVTSTTHKTLRGPRGGIILTNRPDIILPNGKTLAKALDASVFPGNQGGPLEHIIAAKAVCFQEALKPSFDRYQKQVLLNASVLASSLKSYGFDLVGDGTTNHTVILDFTESNPYLTGAEAEKTLEKVGISTNRNMIPNDKRTPANASGIRLGTPALTTQGYIEKDMIVIAGFIAEALKTTVLLTKDESFKASYNEQIEHIRKQVSKFIRRTRLRRFIDLHFIRRIV